MLRPTIFLYVGIYFQKSECFAVTVEPEYASSENSTANSLPQNKTWGEDCVYIPSTPERSFDCLNKKSLSYMEHRVEGTIATCFTFNVVLILISYIFSGQQMSSTECLVQYIVKFEHNISNPLNLPRCPYTTKTPTTTTTTSTTTTASIPRRSSTDDDTFTSLWYAAVCLAIAVAFFVTAACYRSTSTDSERYTNGGFNRLNKINKIEVLRSESQVTTAGGTLNHPTTQESALAEYVQSKTCLLK